MLRPIYIYWLKYKCDHLKRAHFGSNFTSRLIFILFLIIRLNLFFSSTFPYVFICRFDFSYFSCLTFPPFFEVLPGSCYVIKRGMEKSAGILHSSKYLFGVFLFAVHFYNDVTTLSNWALFLFSSDFLLSIIIFSKKYKQGILSAIKLFGDILR